MKNPYKSSHPKQRLGTAINNVAAFKSMEPGVPDWSSLLTDLLLIILGRLPIKDYVRFSAVCFSWNRAVSTNLVPPPRSLWYIRRGNTLTWLMFDVFSNKIQCTIRLPQPSSFRGSTLDGYMFFINKTQLIVMNPLTGSRIRLPSTTTLPKDGHNIVKNAALLRRPNTAVAGGAAVVAIAYNSGLNTRVAFSRSQDKRWTLLYGGEDFRFGVSDMMFYKGLLYVLTRLHGTFIWTIPAKLPPSLIFTLPLNDVYSNMRPIFLVKSSDGEDLFQVHTEIFSEEYNIFKFKEESDGKLNWHKVTNLSGDDALMLSQRGAVCVSTGTFPRLRRNCIYSSKSTGQVNTLLVYCLSDGKKGYIPFEQGVYDWFTPVLRK